MKISQENFNIPQKGINCGKKFGKKCDYNSYSSREKQHKDLPLCLSKVCCIFQTNSYKGK